MSKIKLSNKPLKPIIPQFHNIDGRSYICLRDLMANLVINQILQTDYQLINKKVNVIKEHANSLSPRHRRRIMKQLRKGVRKVDQGQDEGVITPTL